MIMQRTLLQKLLNLKLTIPCSIQQNLNFLLSIRKGIDRIGIDIEHINITNIYDYLTYYERRIKISDIICINNELIIKYIHHNHHDTTTYTYLLMDVKQYE